MSPDQVGPFTLVRHVLGLFADMTTAYDGIERRLSAGAWEGFEEITTVITAPMMRDDTRRFTLKVAWSSV